MRRLFPWAAVILVLAFGMTACARKTKTKAIYETADVEKRNIVVSATATGTIEPVLTVDVKSKASGEIIEMNVETGDEVKPHQLLARIDPREPRTALAQADADLQVAKAQLGNAKMEMARADTFYKRQIITQVEYENARLAYATANAAVVRAQSSLDNARDQMDDTEIRAPLAGTIIAKNVELGTVISSPTRDVGGGTVLLRMADLDTVQVRAMVDETDIGKIAPGLPATITVDAFPDRKFEGSVLKIEPLATVQQNVTMFPVLVRLGNPGHALKPGMNGEVEVHVGSRQGVLAIPYAALRTRQDVASAATVLGLDPQDVQQQLAMSETSGTAAGGKAANGHATGLRGEAAANPSPTDTAATKPQAGSSGTITLPNGSTIPLPPGVKEADVRAVMAKRMNGQELSDDERALMRKVFARAGGGGGGSGRFGGGSGGGRQSRAMASSYIVFVLRNGKPVPVEIKTGLTDLDYIEVLSGLNEGEKVLMLPSAGLVNSQQQMRERFQRMTGGGGLPGVQQSQGSGQRPNTGSK
jgi:HlyD family secretion protein